MRRRRIGVTSTQAEPVPGHKSSHTISQGISCTAAGAHEAIEMLSSLSNPLIADIVSSAHNAIEQVTSVAVSATRSLGISDDEFQDAQRKLLEATRSYVRLHPVTSLGMAVLLGVVASRVMSAP
jgi:ElaB/YqjD/DUF883 family membrane-anchored ribosome-binding protein